VGLEDGNGTVTIKPHTDGEHMSDEVLVERPGAVQVITIKRPEARNALNRAVAVGVRDAVDELDAAAELRAGCSTPLDGGRCHIGRSVLASELDRRLYGQTAGGAYRGTFGTLPYDPADLPRSQDLPRKRSRSPGNR
jgi:hypothetical protein